MSKKRQQDDDEHERHERAEQERRRQQTDIQRLGLSWPDRDPVEPRTVERPAERPPGLQDEPRDEEKKAVPLTITIYDDGKPVRTFAAPQGRMAAIELWAYLVANLRPGLDIRLSGGKKLDITRSSGQIIPPELYRELMLG